jgi:hypothetical protein
MICLGCGWRIINGETIRTDAQGYAWHSRCFNAQTSRSSGMNQPEMSRSSGSNLEVKHG